MVLSGIRKVKTAALACMLALTACAPGQWQPDAHSSVPMPIYPDYSGVTVPRNMVPPRFWVADTCGFDAVQAVFTAGGETLVVNADKRRVTMLERDWDVLTSASDTIHVELLARKNGHITAYPAFDIYVPAEEIDKFIAYRLIEPGYGNWDEMGIYQRCLESYRQDEIITNKYNDYGCINCHSFRGQDSGKWLMQMRDKHPGTYLVNGDDVVKVNIDLPLAGGEVMHPSWHPSGRYVAFSMNDTRKLAHTLNANRLEVYDMASDVAVYDTERNEILSTPLLMRGASLETEPAFGPDGHRLYFCSADTLAMPAGYDRLRYSLCSIDFDPDTREFGERVDTLYNAAEQGRSAAFPRVSPDGRYLMFTVSGYGTCPIWHRDADLALLDLASGEVRMLDALNSDEAESYHSWSSNGRWVVFSSRRIDGLYTRPYIAYIDTDGNPRKPLLLPPPTEPYYLRLMKSYNVPEFIKQPITVSGARIGHEAEYSPGLPVKFTVPTQL